MNESLSFQFESDLSASTNKAETLQKRLTVAEEETNVGFLKNAAGLSVSFATLSLLD